METLTEYFEKFIGQTVVLRYQKLSPWVMVDTSLKLQEVVRHVANCESTTTTVVSLYDENGSLIFQLSDKQPFDIKFVNGTHQIIFGADEFIAFSAA